MNPKLGDPCENCVELDIVYRFCALASALILNLLQEWANTYYPENLPGKYTS